MPDPATTSIASGLLQISLGSAIAISSVCFTVLGAFISWIKIFHGTEDTDNPRSAKQDGYIRRGEWDQACRASNQQYEQIAEALERLESKYDSTSRWVLQMIQDLEKRVGIIEARHRDITGDVIGPGNKERSRGPTSGESMGPYEEPSDEDRRTGRSDSGRRRRSTDTLPRAEGE